MSRKPPTGKPRTEARASTRWKRLAYGAVTSCAILLVLVILRAPMCTGRSPAVRAPCKAAGSAPNVAQGVAPGPTQPEKRQVARFLDHYFKTWSDRDLNAYAACFHASATITYIDAQGRAHAQTLKPFIESQRQVHAAATSPLREIPLRKSIDIDGNVARAIVRWKLLSASGEKMGTDYFTLLKTRRGWKILHLAFRGDPQ